MVFSAFLLPFVPPAPSKLRLMPGLSEERLFDLEASADGSRLLTNGIVGAGFHSRATRLWDARRMRVVAVLGDGTWPVYSSAFSADGKWILTATKAEAVVWDARTGIAKAHLKPKEGDISLAAIDPTGARVAAGVGDDVVQWTVGPGAPPTVVHHSKYSVSGVNYSPDGKLLAVVGGGEYAPGDGDTERDHVVMYDADGLKPLKVLPDAKGRYGWTAFAPGRLLTSRGNGVATIFDPEKGSVVAERPYANDDDATAARGINLGPATWVAGGLAAIPGPDGTITLLDGASGAARGELKGLKGPLRAMRASFDGMTLAGCGADGSVLVWDIATRAARSLPNVHAQTGTTLAFSGEGGLWVGYDHGALRRFDLATLGFAETAPNSPIESIRAFPNGNFMLGQTDYTAPKQGAFYGVFVAGNRTGQIGEVPPGGRPPVLSDDGRRAVVFDNPTPGDAALIDVGDPQSWSGRKMMTYPGIADAVWGPRAKWVLFAQKNGKIALFDGATEKAQWAFDTGPGGVGYGLAASPTGKAVAVCGVVEPKFDPKRPQQRYAVLIDPAKPELWRPIAPLATAKALVRFSADGRRVAVCDGGKLTIRNVPLDADTMTANSIDSIHEMGFSADGTRLWVEGFMGALRVYDLAKGSPLDVKGQWPIGRPRAWTISHDGRTGLNYHQSQVDVYDLTTGKVVAKMPLTDEVADVAFMPGERRVLTADSADGMVVWDFSNRAAPKRLGSFLVADGQDTLTMDEEGRYDADDPAQPHGASYVYAWSGGLESIEVAQMKSRYYEPGLLAKLLGLDPEPRRAVPDVGTLALYPEVRLTRRDDGTVGVGVSERDEGGVGRVELSVNGKVVLTKEGGSYFSFDPKDYRGYLIPSSRLRKGERNELRVVAGNEANDLRSPAETLEIPLPADLTAPPTRLLALCVGAGKYLGGAGSLNSPPSDAKAIGEALKKVSPRLLTGGVDVTTLTTDSDDPEARPSRARILRWFDETAKTAKSTDIVMVFMAGHGTNLIGDKRDYFFLTPDVSPADVTPAAIGVATVSGDDLKAALAKIPANKQVIVLDTCHSGAAAESLLVASRSLAGDYGRAYESIREGSGTWILAGSASDQLSYEATSVDHGMLTYALLEAIDRASPEGLRKAESGELFVDVEGWLKYAVGRVESLKSELDLPGLQQPELRASTAGASFDLGVTGPDHRGELGLRAPRPVVIVGTFGNADGEDPLRLEKAVGASLSDSKTVKPWFDVASHPGAFRAAGTYATVGGVTTLRLLIQRFDAAGDRKTVKAVELKGGKDDLPAKVRAAVEAELTK